MTINRGNRITAALLTSILLLSALISCGEKTGPIISESTSGTGETTAAAAETELAPDLPDKNYDGGVINFLVRSEKFNWYWCSKEIYAEKENGEVINDAVFARNIQIEDKYNCRITEYRSDNPISERQQGYRRRRRCV